MGRGIDMRVCAFFFLLTSVDPSWSQQVATPTSESEMSPEVNTTLMETTFKIVGPARVAGKAAFGTAFLVVKVINTEPPTGNWTLITAAHVLRDIAGDYAVIHMRQQVSDGQFVRSPCKVMIRSNGKDRFTVHRTADVAAFYFAIPQSLKPKRAINSQWIATDELLTELEIHPGDELLSLGYPLGAEANRVGFPILRSGRIASYPIIPMHKHQLLFDFNVFGGNSGGPVYFSYTDRFLTGKKFEAFQRRRDQKLLGLVSQQVSSMATGTPERLGLSVIVPAPFIIETLNLLPPPKQYIECEPLK